MDRRTKFFWSLSLTLAVLVILWESATIWKVHRQRVTFERQSKATVIGTDKELVEVINFLEERLKKRESYRFKARNNPMLLTNAVFIPTGKGGYLQGLWANTIRVSSIVSGSRRYALVQYKGKNYTVQVGDTVGGEKILEVKQEGIVTIRNGKRHFYPIQGLVLEAEQAARYLQRE